MTPAIDITTDQRKTLLTLLRQFIPGVAVWAYGSRAKWTARLNSDLDLVAFTTPAQNPRVSELKEELAESDLPFLVDLHVWDEVPKRFHEIIRNEYVVLQEAEEKKQRGISGWQTIRLGSACEKIGSGATPRGGSEVYQTTGISLIRSQNIYNDGFKRNGLAFIGDKHARELENVNVLSGDVLLNITGDSVARVCQVPDEILPARVNQHVAIIRPKQGTLDARFLHYFLIHPQTQAHMLGLAGAGATRNALTKGMIERFEIKAPSFSEQRAIASVLGTLDDKIESNRRMNETLEALAQSLFKSWFVDATQSALPKGWREATIRELASNIQYGLTQSASIEPVGPRFLRITDIQGGRVDWGSVPFCKVSPEEHERYRIKPGDVLVARTGASTGENIYLPVAPDAVFASYLVRFQFAEPSMARLVGAFMRTPAYFEFVAGCIGGSAQPNASAQVLAGATLAVPPLELIKRFADTVAPFDKRIAANNEESRTLAALRDALLPKLLSGELRVPGSKEVQNG